MEIRLLRYFLAVCEEKNFSRAADKMLVSQPALSKQIKDLEKDLGVTLFIRGHREVTLTEEGYFLRDRAKEMLILNDDTENTLMRNKNLSGVLRVGAGESPNLGCILAALGKIAKDNEDVRIQLEDGDADEVEAKVNTGALDFGVIMDERKLSNFNSLVLPDQNEFAAYFAKDCPLAKKAKISPADLKSYPLIISSQSLVREKFTNWSRNQNLNIIAEYNLPYNAFTMAKKIDAIIITYRDFIPSNVENNFVMRPLTPKLSDPNILIWKKNIKLSHLCTYFIETLKQGKK